MHLLNFVILLGGSKEAGDAQKAMIKRQIPGLSARNRQGYLSWQAVGVFEQNRSRLRPPVKLDGQGAYGRS